MKNQNDLTSRWYSLIYIAIYSNLFWILSLTLNSFLKQYGNEEIQLVFPNKTIKLTLNETHFLWYYIYTKDKNITWNISDNITNIIRQVNAVSLDELDDIIDKYDSIDNIEDLYQFYLSQIKSRESSYLSRDEDYKSMKTRLTDDTIKAISNIDADTLLFHIKQSLKTNEVITSSKYFQTFLDSLPTIVHKTATDTTSYMLMYNLKPFHTEFLLKSYEGVYAQDIQTPKDVYTFDVEITQTDFIDEIFDYQSYDICYNKDDTLQLLDEYEVIVF